MYYQGPTGASPDFILDQVTLMYTNISLESQPTVSVDF